jgi:hypothetical protein
MIKRIKFTLAITVLLSGMMLLINGCKKDADEPIEEIVEAPSGTVTVFTNQTGEANETADGLQVQVLAAGNTIDFYGNFDDLSAPDLLKSIRVTRMDSDTIVNFIINEETGNFERAVFELNGEKLDIVVDFDFPAGDTTMILSHYNYNWETGESEMYYAGEYALSGGSVSETPIFVRHLPVTADGFDAIWGGVGLGVGIAVAETALAVGAIGGASLVGTAAGAVAAAVAAVSSTVIIGVVVVGVALATITNANASDLVPQNTPIPVGTPQGNGQNQALPLPIPVNICIENRVTVIIEAEQDGTLTAIVNGGSGDYTFSWSDGTTVTTANSYHNLSPASAGTYSVVVMDENDCAGSASGTTFEEGLTTLEKLIQWGPWRSQDLEVENNAEILVDGFATLTFSGIDCDCLTVANYEYTNIEQDQYSLISAYSFCFEQGNSNSSFLFDEAPCDMPPEGILTVSSITETGAVITGDGELLNCTPF